MHEDGQNLNIGLMLGRLMAVSETTAERIGHIERRQVLHGERIMRIEAHIARPRPKPPRWETISKRLLTYLLPGLTLAATGDLEVARRVLEAILGR